MESNLLDETPARRIYSITELNTQVHDLIEESFPEIWVEGEVSNCRTYPSGHTYLTLKDADSQIPAVLFRGAAQGLKFKPEDGLKVLARARVSTYIKRGDIQLILSFLEPREKGALQLALEQLKKKLAAEGLFDQERKKPLPKFPKRIGVVTSPQGAAIRDILTVLKRRWNGLEILIHAVRVQGDGAAEEIAAAINNFNSAYPETDVLLAGRGGGSIEDLWAFNEEPVVRAIAASTIPVISCVGHETDFTLADLAADIRAPTPSAAAELAVPEKEAVLEELAAACERMASLLIERLRTLEQRLIRARTHPLLQSPHRLYEALVQRVDELSMRLKEAARRRVERAEADFRLWAGKLDSLSPLKVLDRGYSIADLEPDHVILRSASQVRPGSIIRLRLHEGEVICEAKK